MDSESTQPKAHGAIGVDLPFIRGTSSGEKKQAQDAGVLDGSPNEPAKLTGSKPSLPAPQTNRISDGDATQGDSGFTHPYHPDDGAF